MQVSEFLFKIPNKTVGLDLISLDLERNRDFGVPAYNKFRQLCGLTKAETFDNLINEISQKVQNVLHTIFRLTILTYLFILIQYLKNIAALAKLYEHVDDVDYYALCSRFVRKTEAGSHLWPYISMYCRRDVFQLEIWRQIVL